FCWHVSGALSSRRGNNTNRRTLQSRFYGGARFQFAAALCEISGSFLIFATSLYVRNRTQPFALSTRLRPPAPARSTAANLFVGKPATNNKEATKSLVASVIGESTASFAGKTRLIILTTGSQSASLICVKTGSA